MGTSATTQFPGLTLSVAFGISPTDLPEGINWTDADFTSRLRSFTVTRGRGRPGESFRPGQMTLVLDNADRQLDPDYSAGDYFGQLLPQSAARLQATYNSVTYDVFVGHIQAWPQSWPGQDADAVVTLTVLDILSALDAAPLPDSVWAATMATATPLAWWRLGESLGTVMGDASGNGYHGTYGAAIVGSEAGLLPYSGTNGAKRFDGIDDIGRGALTPNDDYTVVFWARMPNPLPGTRLVMVRQDPGYASLVTNSHQVWAVEVNAAGYVCFNDWVSAQAGQTPPYSNQPVVADSVHMIAVTHDASAFTGALFVDGVEQTNSGGAAFDWTGDIAGCLAIGGITGGTLNAWPSLLDDVATFDRILTDNEIADLYEAGTTPWIGDTSGERVGRIADVLSMDSALKDFDTGSSTLAPATLGGTALAAFQVIEQTEDGMFFATSSGILSFVGRDNVLTEAKYTTSASTFGDGGGSEMKYHDIGIDPGHIDDIKNVGKVSRQGGYEQSYTDASSSLQYGPRVVSLSGLAMATDSEAHDRAAAEVLKAKDPRSRASKLEVKPRRDAANLFPKILGYEIGQRLTVKRRPSGIGTAFSQDVFIQGVVHQCDASSMNWTTTWSTAPTDPNEDAWALVEVARCDQSNAHVAY